MKPYEETREKWCSMVHTQFCGPSIPENAGTSRLIKPAEVRVSRNMLASPTYSATFLLSGYASHNDDRPPGRVRLIDSGHRAVLQYAIKVAPGSRHGAGYNVDAGNAGLMGMVHNGAKTCCQKVHDKPTNASSAFFTQSSHSRNKAVSATVTILRTSAASRLARRRRNDWQFPALKLGHHVLLASKHAIFEFQIVRTVAEKPQGRCRKVSCGRRYSR